MVHKAWLDNYKIIANLHEMKNQYNSRSLKHLQSLFDEHTLREFKNADVGSQGNLDHIFQNTSKNHDNISASIQTAVKKASIEQKGSQSECIS